MPWWGKLIYFIGTWITPFPIIIGLIRLKHIHKNTLFVFLWMCSMFLIQLYSSYQFDLRINNLPSRHLMIFLNATYGMLFFYHSIKAEKFKKLILYSGPILLVFLIIYPLQYTTIYDDDGLSMTVQSYFLMVWSLTYLFDLLRRDEVINLFESPEFIIVIAILLYFGTTQFVQLLQSYVSKHMKEIRHVFRYVDISIMIVYYFLIGVGLWKTKSQKT